MGPSEPDLALDLEGTQWRFVRPLARGGMGEVSVVEHVELGTMGVIKVLRADVDRKEDLTARLRREARMLTRLSHENLVRVLDFGWTRSQRGFLVTELLEGESLGDRLKREPEMPLLEALQHAVATLEGLAVVHKAGFVHRDVKPDNIFLARNERDPSGLPVVKLLDFGIAKVTTPEADVAAGPAPKTATGMLVGTPSYIAPEQAGGGVIDERTDVYAMGCVLFRMIAGRPPFVRMRAVDLLGAHILEPASPPSTAAKQLIPPAADDLVLRALAKSPDERFQSADQMRLAARELLFALARSPRQPAKRSERPPSPAPAGTEPLPRGLPAQRAPATPQRVQARPTLPMPTKERPGLPPTLLDELEAPTLLRRPSPRPVDPMREHRVRAAVIGAAFGLLVLALILGVLAIARL